MKSVYSAVRAGALNEAVCASCLKGYYGVWELHITHVDQVSITVQTKSTKHLSFK